MNIKPLLISLVVLCLWLYGCSSDPNEKANELYVEAVKLISSAEKKTGKEAIKDYEQALTNLQRIVNDYSKSDLAVKLVSDQTLFTGKSMADIKNRVVDLRKRVIAENNKNRVVELRKRVIAENNKAFGAENIVIIRSIKPADAQQKGDVQKKEWKTNYGLKNSDAVRIRETVPGVKRILPILNKQMNVVHERREVDCQLIGTYPYYPEFTQSKIIVGQFLNEAEEHGKAASCVITLELAERLFAEHNPLNEKVIVRGFESSQVFQVKGILQERSANVYIPLSTFKALYGTKNIDRSTGNLSIEVVELTEIRVEFGSVKEVTPALPLLRNCLNKSRKGKTDYEIQTPLLQK